MRTRVLLSTALLLCFAAVPLAAQGVTGGVKAGVVFADVPNIGDFTESAGTNDTVRTGLTGGGFVAWRLNESFWLQAEALFTQKGVRSENSDVPFKLEFDLDYLEVPVLARVNFGHGATRGYVFAGPSFDFKVNAKATTSMFDEPEETEDIDDDVEAFELALVVGGGVEFGRVLIEARYSEGLTDLVKGSDEGLDTKLKNRTFAVLAGVRF